MGCAGQILAACDQGHSLDRIVDRYGEMVARGRLLASQHDIAKRQRVGWPAVSSLHPIERPGQSKRARQIESQSIVEIRSPFCSGLAIAEAAAGAGVERTHVCELVERAPVVFEMLRLPAHRTVPIEPEPGEIFEDRCRVFLPAASPVDILKTQQKTPSISARRAPPFERRANVTEMEIPGRARRKSRHCQSRTSRCK